MILLAEKIFGRRKDLGLSQAELAAKAESTQRIISELENAVYAPSNGIGEELYDKLASALEIDRDYLFSGEHSLKDSNTQAREREKL
jgi:transcriptional regulator with XRE-family HTH domain